MSVLSRRSAWVVVACIVGAVIGFGLHRVVLGGGLGVAGDLQLDFGTVEVENRVELSGEVMLQNPSRRSVSIRDIRSTCGCLSARADREVIAPGAEARVDVHFAIVQPGVKRGRVFIQLDSGREHVVQVSATGRRRPRLHLATEAVDINISERRATAIVIAHTASGDQRPPELVVSAPAGVSASFAGWELVYDAARWDDRGALWLGRIEVMRLVESPVPLEAAALVLAGEGQQRMRLYVAGWPWR
jgi:hypothetical protein